MTDEIDDLDEFDLSSFGPPSVCVPDPAVQTASMKEFIPPGDAIKMHSLLWGSGCRPSSTWKQGFFFSQAEGLQFGLVQQQGGPCGVFAAVQAHLLGEIRSNV